MDSLERIRVFHMIAEHGSFAEAARQLRIDPVAATRAIATLEAELGAQLLRRTTRSVSLTEVGADYLIRSRRVLDELEDAARAVRGEDAVPRGLLVVTAPVLFGRMHIMPIVSKMLQENPGLSIRLTLLDRVVRLAEEGFDVAIRIAHLPDSALHAAPLTTVSQVLVASPEYLASRGIPVSLEDLVNHDLISFDSATLNAAARRTVVEAKLSPRFLTNSIDATLEAALQGVGIARLFSYHVTKDIADGRLVVVLPDAHREVVPVSMVYQAKKQQSPNLTAFMAACRQALQGLPPI